MPRIVLILVAVPVVLIIAAALLIPALLDEEKLLAMAAETLEKETGAVLLVEGGASLSVFPNITLELGDASITMPGEQEMSISVGALGIGVELMPLLSRQIEIGDITIDGLVMTLQSAPEQPALDTSTLSDEQLDAYYAKRRQALEEAGQAAGQESIAALPLALNVQRLLVTNSVLEVVSADAKETSRVKIVELEAKNLNLDDNTIPLTLHVQLDGEEGAPPMDVKIDGAVRVNGTTQLLTLENVALAVRGVLDQAVTASASGVIDLVKQAADLQIELALGEIRGDGSVRYASFETPQINAKMHFNQFDPALLALAGPDAAVAADTEATGSASDGDQALPLNAIRAIDTKAILSIDEAKFSGHTVKKMQVKLRAVDGIVRINSLTGSVHGGKLNMKATFNAKHNTAKLNTKGGLTSMGIGLALQAMGSEPVMTGKADLQWQLSSNGSTSNQLIERMKGPIDLQTRKVVLKNMGVEKMLCETVAMANQESLKAELPDITTFNNLSVKLRMNKGKVQMKPFRAELANVKLRGEGAFDILPQNFKATFTATLSPGLGKLDPACRVNDRLTAIAWPLNCKGSLDGDPADWCGVDSQQIIEDLATKEAVHQLEKEGRKLLDKLLKKN